MSFGKFVVIRNSRVVTIDDDNPVWSERFGSGGRVHGESAFLFLNVIGLTRAEKSPDVLINGKKIGVIRPYNDADPRHGYTQIIGFDGSILHRDADTANDISITGVPTNKVNVLVGNTPLEPYKVKDVVLFYRTDGFTGCNFAVLQDNTTVRLGEQPGADRIWRAEFEASPKDKAEAYLYLNISGLTGSRDDLDVVLNGVTVGDVDDYFGSDPDNWYTQAVWAREGVIRPGKNTLEIRAVGTDQNVFIKGVVCLYEDKLPIPGKPVDTIIPIATDKVPVAGVLGGICSVTDSSVVIGDTGEIAWVGTFDAPGLVDTDDAVLFLTLNGLTQATRNADVVLNGQTIGTLSRYQDTSAAHAHTQIVVTPSGVLRESRNRIKISAVGNTKGKQGDSFDDFALRAALCLYPTKVVK